MRFIFYKFWVDIVKVFSGRNILWHLLAIILTYVLVVSGFDFAYFLYFNGGWIQTLLFPAVILGGLLPIILSIILYAVGKFRKSPLEITAYAVAQAGLLGWLISTIYKVFTGRIQPELFSSSLLDISRDFQFGFLRHGIFWGWPSSHTTVAFAIAVTLLVLYPQSRAVKTAAVLTALYIGFGVSMSIHWFSDFIAGAIFGSLIGYVVGKTFSSRELSKRIS